MNKNLPRMPLSELKETTEFLRLTPRQQLYVSTYVETGMALGRYDDEAAIRMAYRCSTDESVRVMRYALKRSIKVVEVLNMHFGKNATAAFLDDVNRAIRNKHLTQAQLEAIILKSKILGIDSSLGKTNRSRHLKKKRDERKKLKKSKLTETDFEPVKPLTPIII